MKIVVFSHGLTSCWNHGNAHFLRGVLRALVRDGHTVASYEPRAGWSRENLRQDGGAAALAGWQSHYPELRAAFHDPDTALEALVADADVVLVHEWNEPALVAAVGRIRAAGGGFRLLFHDTHHRAVSDPDAMRRFDLRHYDGVLAFGRTLADVYRREGWAERVFVWHEAADLALFHPPDGTEAGRAGAEARRDRRDDAEARPDRRVEATRQGAIWIGNWGDGERGEELERFLLRPAHEAALALTIRGVRYPDDARALLDRTGARYAGWIANAEAPAAFARHLLTVHVPRRFYAASLPGIPTIRVFEALACGIPLLCAPWEDSEHLFRPGTDYLVARDGDAMTALMRDVVHDAALRRSLVAHGLETIRARHSCAHRARELVAIAEDLRR